MTFYDFLQKISIWVLSLIPFAIVSLTYMPAFGPHVSAGSLIAIFHCMTVLAGCMYLAERWMAFWRVEDADDRGMVMQRESERLAQAAVARAKAKRVEEERMRAGYQQMLAGRAAGH